jgi:hypothetical protein
VLDLFAHRQRPISLTTVGGHPVNRASNCKQHEGKSLGLRSLLKWVGSCWMQEIKEELSYCEFECRNYECNASQWKACELRLGHTMLSKHAVMRVPMSQL